jgi:PAS domain S-box-containing protein
MNNKQQPSNQPYVLIVDDIEANLVLIKTILKPLGVNLILAISGAEALQKISNHDIAIALIDIHMPGMNGFELAQQIQKPATSELIPVIFITAQAGDQSVIEKYYSKGVVDFIVKPFQKNILLRKVMVMLEMHQQKKQLLNQKAEMKLLVEELEIANQSLSLRLLYENLLVKVSEMAVSVTSIDHFCNSSLAEIGTTIKASRTYIIEYCSITQTLSNTFEWCAEGISAQKQNLQNLPVAQIPWWHNTLKNGDTINYYNIEDIPEQSTREILKAQDIFSILVVPLFINGNYFGHVGFDFCYHRHEWQDMDVELLISISRIFCSVIERNIAESERLKRMETEHALLNASLDSVFLIDANGVIIAHNEIMVQKLNLKIKNIIGKCIWDFLPSDVCRDRKSRVDEVFRTGLPLRFEDTRAAFTFEHSIYPVTDALGKVYRVAVYGHDITERKRAEEALRESRELLNATQRLAKVGGWEWDVGRQKMSWTEETYRIHGFGLNELPAGSPEHIQRSLACYDPDDRPIIEATFLRCVEKGDSYNLEFPFTNVQGERGWVRTMARPEMDGKRVVKVIGNFMDITEKRKAEEALRVSEKMYRTLLSAAPQGIIILNMKRIITDISDITIEIFGASSKSDFIGNDFFEIIPEKEADKLKTILSKTISDGLVQSEEIILEKKNKSPFVGEISATLIQDDDGSPKAYMIIVRDISQKKIVEQQLIRSERMVSLGEMASGMAHEINQPLLSIQLGIENRLNKIQQINTTDKSYLKRKSEKIFEDIVRIGQIIDHVRAFSRDQEYIHTTFNINESIQNAIAMISQQFKHHDIRLSVNFSNDVNLGSGNTYRFEQVILNLLSNAKDAIEEKEKKQNAGFDKCVTLKTYQANSAVFVEVQDNGCGIDENEMSRLMLPFYTTKIMGKGTGLGLAISFSIVKELNGNIEIESKPGIGSTFRIQIPAM